MRYLLLLVLLLACSNPVQFTPETGSTSVMHTQDYSITIIFKPNDTIQRASDLYYTFNGWNYTTLFDTTILRFTKSWQGEVADSTRLLQVQIKYHVWLLDNNSEKILRERSIQTFNSIVIEEGE